MKLVELLLLEEYNIFQGMVRVTFRPESTVMEIADIIRAIRGVTIVNTAGNDEEKGISSYEIKIRTRLKGLDAFKIIRQEALKHSEISRFEIAPKTINKR